MLDHYSLSSFKIALCNNDHVQWKSEIMYFVTVSNMANEQT